MSKVNIPSPIVDECNVADICRPECGMNCFCDAGDDEVYLLKYPTVYIVYANDEVRGRRLFDAYVGETNDIIQRTLQHFRLDPKERADWAEFKRRMDRDSDSVHQFVIGHPHFNKSLTLDFENRMMQYLLGVDAVRTLNNRRANPQGLYYTRLELDSIFHRAWRKLHRKNPELFPAESVIRDSALFKASPFHELSEDQIRAENQIVKAVSDAMLAPDADGGGGCSGLGKLILVTGAAGTGKTVLISHLFNRLKTDLLEDAGDAAAFILINHDEQKTVYNQIATKLGLQKHVDDVVLKPVQFINRFSKKRATPSGKLMADIKVPEGTAEVALIDEAHLLLTQGNQGYAGKNMLLDVMRRARVAVAVFDPAQVLESGQQWDPDDLKSLLDENNDHERITLKNGSQIERTLIHLSHQFRMAAGPATISWLDTLLDEGKIGQLHKDRGYYKDGRLVRDPYEVRVFDSPVDLYLAIREKATAEEEGSRGLSRVLATYDWAYSSERPNDSDPGGKWNVELHKTANGTWAMGLKDGDDQGFIKESDYVESSRFCHPWNYMLVPKSSNGKKSLERLAWAEEPETIDEIGSTFTIQGFDLNYAGVIIGPSVRYRDGKIVFDKKSSKSRKATQLRDGEIDYSEQNLRNELNVLLKRGVHGLYLFAVDSGLQQKLKESVEE